MKRVLLATAACLVACGKGEPANDGAGGRRTDKATEKAPDPAAAPDPACVAKTKELEPWLAQLEIERASHEVDFGYELVVIERAASPVAQKIDNVMITPTSIEAFDISEPNRADTRLGKHPAQDAVVERFETIRAMPAGDARDAAPDDRIRIDIDQRASWADITRTVEAAIAAGYTEAVFTFTATSTLTPPAGVEPVTTTYEVTKAASERLEELRQTACKPLGGALLSFAPDKTKEENARELARKVAAALVECNCAADPDEIRRLMWVDARWHQARPRVGVAVKLGGDGAQAIEQAKDTPWSEAHRALLAAVADGAPPPAVTFVAK